MGCDRGAGMRASGWPVRGRARGHASCAMAPSRYHPQPDCCFKLVVWQCACPCFWGVIHSAQPYFTAQGIISNFGVRASWTHIDPDFRPTGGLSWVSECVCTEGTHMGCRPGGGEMQSWRSRWTLWTAPTLSVLRRRPHKQHAGARDRLIL